MLEIVEMKLRRIVIATLVTISILITLGTGLAKTQTTRVTDASAYGFSLPWLIAGGFGLVSATSANYNWFNFCN